MHGPDSKPELPRSNVRTAVCPGHLIGHPTVVVTQSRPMSPPLAPIDHASFHKEARNKSSLPASRRAGGSCDDAFEAKLWSMVPASFLPSPVTPSMTGTATQRAGSQRPTADDTMDRSGWLSPRQGRADSLSPREALSRLSLTREMNPLVETHYPPSRKRRSSSPLDISERSPPRHAVPTLHSAAPCPKELPTDEDSPFSVTEATRPNLFSPPNGNFLRRHRASTSVATGRDQIRESSPTPFLLRCQSWDPDTPTRSPTDRRANRSFTPTRYSRDSSPNSPIGNTRRGSRSSAHMTRILEPLEPLPLELWRAAGDRLMTTGAVHISHIEEPSTVIQTDVEGPSTDRSRLKTPSPESDSGEDAGPFSPSDRQEAIAEVHGVFRTPTKNSSRRHPISPVMARVAGSESSSRRSSFTDQNPCTPMPRTPIFNIQRHRMSLNEDASRSSDQGSSLLTSPSVGIQWSPSMETPVKKRTSMGPLKTPIENLRMKLQGIPPPGTSEPSLDVADCDGWSTNLETPPRKVVVGSAERADTLMDDGVLAKLRGVPNRSPLLVERRHSSSSLEGSFYSASSSLDNQETDFKLAESAGQERIGSTGAFELPALVVKKEEVEKSPFQEDSHVSSWATADLNIKPEDMGVAPLSVPSVPLIDTDLTLPMSFLQNIQDPESPILQSTQASDSGLLYDDHLDGISSSALDKALQSKSNESSAYATQNRRDSRSQRSNREGGPYSRDTLRKGSYPSHSQDILPENLPLDEPWILSSPVMDEHDMDLDVKVEDTDNGFFGDSSAVHTGGNAADIEDDFDNIAFSQLDDGFNVMEPTQRPPPQHRKSSSHTKEAQVAPPVLQELASAAKPRIVDEADWLSTSNAMLGDMLVPSADDSVPDRLHPAEDGPQQPPPTLMGFASAAGKKLKPVSKATLAKFAHLFDDDGESGETGVTEIGGRSKNHEPPIMAGFSSGAGKKLAPISKDALKRAAGLFDNDGDDLDYEDSATRVQKAVRDAVPPMIGFASAGSKTLVSLSKEAQERARRLFEDDTPSTSESLSAVAVQSEAVLTGFASGAGRKLGPASNSSMEKWSKKLAMVDTIIPPIHTTVGGFSSGKGNPLAPISESARGRALGLLEMVQPSVSATSERDSISIPLTGKNTLPPSAQGPKPPQAPKPPQINGKDSHVPRQSAISANMANLMMKSLRANSAGKSSLTGVLKPVSKSKLPFKSPMQFKSPMNTERAAAFANGNSTSTSTSTIPNPKKVIGKKALHPNAKPNLTSPAAKILEAVPAPSFKALYNLSNSGMRMSLQEALCPPKRRDISELLRLGVPKDALDMTLTKANGYQFSEWGVEQALGELLRRGATPDLLSPKWVWNHYRLVVWKLACYVRFWPETFLSAECFCPGKVLDQLAYRYEREINRAERPALRKIVEGDDSASRHMVLCIADIASEFSEEAQNDSLRVKVTDGWYILSAVVDPTLERSIKRGRLAIGSKIHVCRGKLNGADNGAAILELMEGDSSVSLVLQANNTRLARWDTKLGFQSSPLLWTKRLRSITPEGGLVPGVDVVVLRKYPVVYLETLSDGVTKIKRTAREEERAAEAHQESLQSRYQQIVQEVEKEFGGSGADTEAIRMEVESRAHELQSEASRNVTPMFTIRVGNYIVHSDRDHEEEALVTFWSNVHTPYSEGHRVRITSLIAKKKSREPGFEDMIQLVGTRQTTVKDMPVDTETMTLTHYQPRVVTLCADVGQLYYGAEMDLAVIVLATSEVSTGLNNKQYAVVTDNSMRLLLIEHQGSGSSAPSSTPFKMSSKILIANARYKNHDGKLGLDIISCPQSYTQLTVTQGSSSTSWPAYAVASLQRLEALAPGPVLVQGRDQEQQTIGDLIAQANAILCSMNPSL